MSDKVITIDGPAASGKTSVSRELAKRLGWNWVSTGAFYRGLAYVAQQKQVDLKDQKALANICAEGDWHVELTQDHTLVIFQGQDVTSEIFKEQVGSIASQISQYPEVRAALLKAQRDMALVDGLGLIAEGRDCGTVVFPKADFKVYLTARSEDRAMRRAMEQGEDVEKTLSEQKIRDKQDSTRKSAPLQIPEGAFVVDTSTMDLSTVVSHIEQKLRSQFNQESFATP